MISVHFQRSTFLFYLLGQNSYNLRASKFSVWLQHIPNILSLLTAIVGICWHLLKERSLHRPVTIVSYIKLIVAVSVNAMVFLEFFVMPNGVRKLNFAYKDAIDYLERKLHVKIDYMPFKRSFRCKVRIVLLVFLLVLGIKILFNSYVGIESDEIAQFFIYYLKEFALMHILFHIDFVNFLMETINREFNPLPNQCEYVVKPIQPKTIELLLALRHCKYIHFRVWEIFRILNIRFGWVLVALLLAILLDISYSSYWLWVFLYIHKSSHEQIKFHQIMRKYVLLFVIFFFRWYVSSIIQLPT